MAQNIRQPCLSADTSPSTKANMARMTVVANLRFTVEIFTRLLGGEPTFDADTEGWRTFRRAVKIRNRVTHPKSVENLELTDADIKCLIAAAHWYEDYIRRLTDLVAELPEGNENPTE